MLIKALPERLKRKKKLEESRGVYLKNDDFGNFTNFKVHFVFLQRFF
jgi:hypothetical protein